MKQVFQNNVPIFHKMPGAGLAFSTLHDTSVSCPAIAVIGSELGRSEMMGKTGRRQDTK
jgi:hypothetical protein